MNQPSSRDLEQISAHLDGQLSQADSARLESRLKSDPELRSVYQGLRQSRALLRQLPARRAPRNFRLTPKMAGIRPPLPRVFPVFRLASAFAAILFFLGYAFNLSTPLAASMRASATSFAYDANSAPAIEIAPMAATEAPQTFAPKIAASQEAPLATQDNAALTATPEIMALEVPPAETLPQPNANFADPYATMPIAPQAPALPIHPIWLFGFLGLAVVSGAGAFFVRVQTEQNWSKANAARPVRLEARDLFLIALFVVVVLLLAAGVYWMSTGFLYAPFSDTMTYPPDFVGP